MKVGSWKTRRVLPTGEEVETSATVCMGPRRDRAIRTARQVYPPSFAGDRLREVRHAIHLSVREAAARLGMAPQDLNDLEFGRAVLDDDGEWERAEVMLRGEDR